MTGERGLLDAAPTVDGLEDLLDGLLDTAADAARAGGEVLLHHRSRLLDGADLGVSSKTSTTDPVSEADRHSEQVITQLLATRRPEDGLLGEEGSDRPSTTGIRWVIDPLDGTVNFLYGHVGWCVSIAAEARTGEGWVPVAGAVCDPVSGVLHSAVRGRGATADGRALRVNDPVELPRALVATGFAYDREHRSRQAGVASALLGQVRDVRRVGSAALDLCAVASGAVDAYYEDSTQRWDWAAGALIAAEAGAVVTPLLTWPGHAGVVAAGPSLHPRLVPLVG